MWHLGQKIPTTFSCVSCRAAAGSWRRCNSHPPWLTQGETHSVYSPVHRNCLNFFFFFLMFN